MSLRRTSLGEQIGGFTRGTKERRVRKKQAHRRVRQQGKALLDDAPKKLGFSGWSD